MKGEKNKKKHKNKPHRSLRHEAKLCATLAIASGVLVGLIMGVATNFNSSSAVNSDWTATCLLLAIAAYCPVLMIEIGYIGDGPNRKKWTASKAAALIFCTAFAASTTAAIATTTVNVILN